MPCQTALQLCPVEDSLNDNCTAARYVISADIEPSVLPRILENFALRNLTPRHLTAHQDEDELTIEVTVGGLSRTEQTHLELRLQNILPVRSVCLEGGA